MDEQNALLGHFGHLARVARADPVPQQVTVEERDIALAPVPRVALLRARETERNQGLDLERVSPKDPLDFEALAHRVVDLDAARPGGRKEDGPGPRLGREPEPETGCRLRERLGRNFVEVSAKALDGLRGRSLDHVEHRGLEVGVALAPDVVQERGRHPRKLKLPEGLARLDAPELADVANEDQARDAHPIGDPKERPRLRGARERHLVDDEERAAVLLGQLLERLRIRHPVRDLAAAGEEPLQGRAAKAGLAGERARCRRRWSEPRHPAPLGERRHPAEHHRLAGSGIALHADRAVAAFENEPRRLALSLGEALERLVLDRARDERLRRPDTRLHPLDDLTLGVHRPRRGPRLARAPADRGDEMAVANELGERPFKGLEGMDAGRVRERERKCASHGKDRRALLELPDGPPRDLERRRRLGVPHPDLAALAFRDPPLAHNLAPQRLELLAPRLALSLPDTKRRSLRRARAVAPAPIPDEVEDLAPAARERLERLP